MSQLRRQWKMKWGLLCHFRAVFLLPTHTLISDGWFPMWGCGTLFLKNLKESYGLRINAKKNLEIFMQTLKYAGFISISLCVSLCEVCLYWNGIPPLCLVNRFEMLQPKASSPTAAEKNWLPVFLGFSECYCNIGNLGTNKT